MTDCTNKECCNTCENGRVKYDSPMRGCAVDTSPYANYLGGHGPDYVCEKYKPCGWFVEKRNRQKVS